MPDKFEREIEDILSKLEAFPNPGPAHRARAAISGPIAAVHRRIAARLTGISIGQIMLTGIVMILVGYLFRTALLGFSYYVIVTGLILFFGAFFLSLLGAGRSRGRGQPYWRGRPAQSFYSNGPTLAARLREWWQRRQRWRS